MWSFAQNHSISEISGDGIILHLPSNGGFEHLNIGGEL